MQGESHCDFRYRRQKVFLNYRAASGKQYRPEADAITQRSERSQDRQRNRAIGDLRAGRL
jgi:hypothetical protein